MFKLGITAIVSTVDDSEPKEKNTTEAQKKSRRQKHVHIIPKWSAKALLLIKIECSLNLVKLSIF